MDELLQQKVASTTGVNEVFDATRETRECKQKRHVLFLVLSFASPNNANEAPNNACCAVETNKKEKKRRLATTKIKNLQHPYHSFPLLTKIAEPYGSVPPW